MPATMQTPQVPGSNANVDLQLRTSFDLLSKQVADLEVTYRDLGLKFFVLRIDHRANYFGEEAEDAKQVFLCQADGSTSQAAQLLTSLRPALDQIRGHLHRLRFEQIYDADFAAAEKKLREANRVHGRANAWLRPIVDFVGGLNPHGRRSRSGARLGVSFSEIQGGVDLPRSDADERYADFRAWALTVRDVQSLIAFGESEDDAIASLGPEMASAEERIVPYTHVDYGYIGPDGEVSDDDYFTESDGENDDDDSSSASNPFEDPYDDTLRRLGYLDGGGAPVGHGRVARPNIPPPAFQFR